MQQVQGITQVDGVDVQALHRASCHCGAVQLDVKLPNGIVDPRRCDCSYCRRRGTVVASVGLDDIHIVAGSDALQRYQFNTGTAQHWFCRHCGIHTHHQRRSNPQQYAINVGCLTAINPFALGPVPTRDGVHHPADRNPADPG